MVSSRPTSSWILSIQRLRWEFDACKPSSAKKLLSIADASKSSYSPDLEVNTKALERAAEAIGEDIAAREQQQI